MKPGCRLLLTGCFAFLALFISVSASAASDSTIERERIKLKEITEKIRQKKQAIRSVKQKEASILTTLNKIEQQLLQEKKKYTELTDKISDIKNKISQTQQKLRTLEAQLHNKEQYLHKRLRALYKYYKRNGIRILLSSASCNEFMKHEKFLGDIVRSDHTLFRACSDALQHAQSYRKDLGRQQDTLLAARENLLQRQHQIKNAKTKKVAFLKEIKQEKSLQLNTLKELEARSKKLQSFINDLQKNKKTFTARRGKFSTLRGRLRFPVDGEIISTFGKKEHPELHTYTYRKGIDIKAPAGAEIKAVYDGKVVFADWFKGYGYMIIIDHGENYYSLSAHASELIKEVDDIVSEGETIALVGDTNSMKGNCLHFEIRHHGKPEDPLRWLRSR